MYGGWGQVLIGKLGWGQDGCTQGGVRFYDGKLG